MNREPLVWYLFSFSHRLPRLPYVLCLAGFLLTVLLIAVVVHLYSPRPRLDPAMGLALSAALVPLTAKRLHDRDRSAWWALLLFVPGINLWILFEVVLLRGTVGPNRFGLDPLLPDFHLPRDPGVQLPRGVKPARVDRGR